jgi:hypothetical protein
MVDLKKATDELTTKAAFDAAKNAAERALNDALSSDEERAQRKAEEEALAKRKRKKLLALTIVGLLVVLGLIGMVLSYWQWFLLAGLLGLAALYGRHRWRRRRAEKKDRAAEKLEQPSERPTAKDRKELPAPPTRVASPAPTASPEPVENVEDELAALKARLGK